MARGKKTDPKKAAPTPETLEQTEDTATAQEAQEQTEDTHEVHVRGDHHNHVVGNHPANRRLRRVGQTVHIDFLVCRPHPGDAGAGRGHRSRPGGTGADRGHRPRPGGTGADRGRRSRPGGTGADRGHRSHPLFQRDFAVLIHFQPCDIPRFNLCRNRGGVLRACFYKCGIPVLVLLRRLHGRSGVLGLLLCLLGGSGVLGLLLHPEARQLIVSTAQFPAMRKRLDTPGTAEAKLYKRVKEQIGK